MTYLDPLDQGNSEKFHTGKLCIEANCLNKAGTAWSPYWCFTHNVERIKRIDNALEELTKSERT